MDEKAKKMEIHNLPSEVSTVSVLLIKWIIIRYNSFVSVQFFLRNELDREYCIFFDYNFF